MLAATISHTHYRTVPISLCYFKQMSYVVRSARALQAHFLLEQWREIEEMLVERGAADTGITI
jgi:hypothetical protein